MKTSRGLTLIEVLIALAVVSIALMAVIKAASQSIRAITYLQNKTLALWVGTEVLNEIRVAVRPLPETRDQQTTTLLGTEWYWEAQREDTPNQHIKKVEVSVFSKTIDDQESDPLVTLTSYVEEG